MESPNENPKSVGQSGSGFAPAWHGQARHHPVIDAGQTEIVAPIELPVGMDAASFDLARQGKPEIELQIIEKCDMSQGEVIVVCGRRDDDRYRAKLPDPHGFDRSGPPKAEIGLGDGASAAAEVEQVDFGNGFVSNRIMIRLKFKF